MADQAELRLRMNSNYFIDENELDDLTYQLHDEIEKLDVRSVDLVKGTPGDQSAIPIEWTVLGDLSVKLVASAVPPVVEALKAWLATHQPKGQTKKKLTIQIQYRDFTAEVEHATPAAEMIKIEDTLRQVIEKG